jgi:Arc/MetJ family transcription regulator
MRTTLNLDEDLLREALKQTGARTKTEVLEMGLRALLEKEARRRLKGLFGEIPKLELVKRRR